MADERLFTPITIGDQVLKNRILMAPLTRARCEPTDDPYAIENSLANDLMKEYYTQRASAGLIITEGMQVSERGWGWWGAPKMESKQHAESWKPVVDAVHAKGGLIYSQLWHLGRQSHSTFHPSSNKIYSASAVKITSGQSKTVKGEPVEHEVPTPLSKEEIKETVQEFVNAAKMAKLAGFDGIEIHSANGYLIDQFLQSRTNKRTDEYGGSMENRLRLLREIVEGIIADPDAFDANRIGFRLSPNGVYGDMGSEDNDKMFPYVAKEMNKYGLAYMHVVDGFAFGKHDKSPAVTVFDLKKHFDGPVIANAGLTKDMGEGMIRSGAADLAAYGRPFISNPDLVERYRNNWPLNPDATYESWWTVGMGAKGYTDYPFYKKEEKAQEVEEEKKQDH